MVKINLSPTMDACLKCTVITRASHPRDYNNPHYANSDYAIRAIINSTRQLRLFGR